VLWNDNRRKLRQQFFEAITINKKDIYGKITEALPGFYQKE
jgi:hypothetical protein